MDAIETITVGPLTVTLYPDDSQASDPRDADNLGVMVCEHRDYKLGDSATEGWLVMLKQLGVAGFAKRMRAFYGTTVLLPLYLLDHSGLSMRAGEPVADTEAFNAGRSSAFAEDPGGFDTSAVGFIFDTAATRETCGTPVELVTEGLRQEVATYAAYLQGDVYGFVVSDANGTHVDSCWGFVGELDYCRSEGIAAAKAFLDDPDWTPPADFVGEVVTALSGHEGWEVTRDSEQRQSITVTVGQGDARTRFELWVQPGKGN